jgi:predicted O-methyltransferase YrrM
MDIDALSHIAERAIGAPAYPDCSFPFSPSIYYRFLRILAEEMHPALSVELGVSTGGGGMHLALGNPEGRVIGVDISNHWPKALEYVIETCPNFEFWQRDSVEAAEYAKRLWSQYDDVKIVDILFIDTIHTYEQVMAEFTAWKSLLASHAVVLLDDLQQSGVNRAWEELPGSKVSLDVLHSGSGFGAICDLQL